MIVETGVGLESAWSILLNITVVFPSCNSVMFSSGTYSNSKTTGALASASSCMQGAMAAPITAMQIKIENVVRMILPATVSLVNELCNVYTGRKIQPSSNPLCPVGLDAWSSVAVPRNLSGCSMWVGFLFGKHGRVELHVVSLPSVKERGSRTCAMVKGSNMRSRLVGNRRAPPDMAANNAKTEPCFYARCNNQQCTVLNKYSKPSLDFLKPNSYRRHTYIVSSQNSLNSGAAGDVGIWDVDGGNLGEVGEVAKLRQVHLACGRRTLTMAFAFAPLWSMSSFFKRLHRTSRRSCRQLQRSGGPTLL